MTHVEQSTCEMMADKRVAVSELAEWYRLAIESSFEHDRFTLLPSYTACVKLFDQAQQNVRWLREAAEAVTDSAPLPREIRQIAACGSAKTMSELFQELKQKFE